MKRLLIILLCLPLIFACTKEEPFVEGEEIVLDMSVNTDDVNAFATRAMGDKVDGRKEFLAKYANFNKKDAFMEKLEKKENKDGEK